MEKHIVLEKNHQCTSSNIVSKSMESSIKIDSISIDLINANEKNDVENCEHFSIRGFVSEIRKKDWKICWPFASDVDSNKCDVYECGLPPIHVPKFRYWRCQNCMWEIRAGGVENDYGPLLKSCSGGFKSNISCSHESVLGDVPVLLSDLHHLPKKDVPEGKKIDANGFADTAECHPPSCINVKEKNTKTNGLTVAHGMDLDDNPRKEIQFTSGNSSVMQKTYHSDDIGNLKSKCNFSVDICQPGFGQNEVADTELAESCKVKNATAISEKRKMTFVAEERKELAACDIPGEDCNNKEACYASKGSELCSPELNEFDYASSDSAEIIAGNNLHRGDSSGLHRRKTRKVRLLTELLNDIGNGDTNNLKANDALLNAITDASTNGNKHLVLQGRVAIQGKARRCLGQHRKRKLDQDEDWRPLGTGSPKKACKATKILKRDVEFTDAIAKAFARMQLQTSMKNHYTKRRDDGSFIIGKKKNKKALNFEEGSSIVPVNDVLIEAGENTDVASKDYAVDAVLPNPIPKAVTGREINFFPLSSQRMDRKPSFKKKSKVHDVDDQQATLIPRSHVHLKDLTSTKSVDLSHIEPVRVPFHSARDASCEGLNLSLNSYLTMQGYDMQHDPLVEDMGTPLLTWQEGNAREDQINQKTAETNYSGNFIFPSKSASGMPFGKGICADMNSQRITNCMPPNEKQSCTSQVEIGSCSHMQQKNFFGTDGNRKAIGIMERSPVLRKDSDQKANKAPEQGNLDDIPMEIVELMAKHQYERRLPDVEYDRCRSEMTNSTKSCQMMNFNKSYANAEMSLFHLDTTQKQNPYPKNSRNGIAKRGEIVGPMKQKVDYFCQADLNQFNVSRLHRTPVPGEFQVFFQHQEKSSSGIQQLASTSGRQNSAQSYKWIGDFLGKRSSNNCLQTSGMCNACVGITQQSKDANRIWSSMVPNHMPFLHSIPQKCASLSTNIDVLPNSSSNVHKENVNGDAGLKFLNENAISIGKQNRNFDSEILRTCAEYPLACKHNGIELDKKSMGSLDLYANETIPAMHLLSLMDAGGLRSSSPINLDTNSKFLKRTSMANDQDPKEFSRLDSGVYKVSDAVKHTLYDHCGKDKHIEDSQRHISAAPAVVGPSAFSFEHDKSFKKAIDLNCQVSQERLKGKSSDLHKHNTGCRAQKSISPGGNFSSNCGSFPVHSMQTMYFGALDSAMFPLQCSGLDNSTNKLEAPNSRQPVCPRKSSSEAGICSVNRNPADFSVPEAGNLYMIAGEDLKFGKMVPFANAYGSTRFVGQKRQKKIPVKEHRRHLVS